MTPNQSAVWQHTYQAVLAVALPRAQDFASAIQQAALEADRAARLHPDTIGAPTPEPEQPKRGPGRPPKERSE